MANKNVVIVEPTTVFMLDYINFNLSDPAGPRAAVNYSADPGGVVLVPADFTAQQRTDITTALNHVLAVFKTKKGGY